MGGNNVKIVHFIGATKPWLVSFDEAGNALLADSEKHSHLHLKLWWQIFNNLVRPQLNKQVASSENTNLVCLETVTCADYMDTPPSPDKRPQPVAQDNLGRVAHLTTSAQLALRIFLRKLIRLSKTEKIKQNNCIIIIYSSFLLFLVLL